ncbi:hypothetical protein [Streptomyces sp. WG-D5]
MPKSPPANTPATGDTSAEELAILEGGPAHGLRLHVTDRPPVVQVTRPCAMEEPPASQGLRAEALYVYRRDLHIQQAPLRYGFDRASP